jgi:hypothetical protein
MTLSFSSQAYNRTPSLCRHCLGVSVQKSPLRARGLLCEARLIRAIWLTEQGWRFYTSLVFLLLIL